MAGTSNISSIPLLKSRDGYPTWKFKMRMLLIHEELWVTIIGYPEGDKTSQELRNKNDQKALSKICLTIDGSAITHVRTASSAKEAWDALCSAYEDKSLGRKLSLERKLYRYSLNDFDNLELYLTAITTTAQDLADIGKRIEDSSLAAIMLGGLTPRFEPLIMALEHCNVEVTSEMVRNKLLSEMIHGDGKVDVDAAFASSKRVVTCYRCGKRGHKSPNCRLNKKKETKNETTSGKTTMVNHTTGDGAASENRSMSSQAVTEVTSTTLSAPCKVNTDKWIIDSGATAHMTSRGDWLQNYKQISGGRVTVANGEDLVALGCGEVPIYTNSIVNKVSDVLHVPELNCNLLSVKKVVEKDLVVVFDKSGCNFYKTGNVSFDNEPLVRGICCGGLYNLDCTVNLPQYVSAYNVHSDKSRFQLWHKRLGHLCRIGMDLLRKGLADGVEYTDNEVDKESCIPCIEGKQARKPFKRLKHMRATSTLEVVWTDVCGPMSTNSFKGNKYFIIFVDDYTRFTFLYCMSAKTEVKKYFCAFQSLVERQTGAKIRRLHSDNGTEIVNSEMTSYLQSQGIQHTTTAPYSPQQNGISERCNRSIVEKARSMLSHSSLSHWQDAVETSVYLKNRSPHRALVGKTPFEMWYGKKPNLSHLKVFGCRALVHVPSCQRTKLDMKATEHIFVGYSEDPRSYFFRQAENPRRILKSRDVTFFESNFTGLKEKVLIPEDTVNPNLVNLLSQNSSPTSLSLMEDVPSTSTSQQSVETVSGEQSSSNEQSSSSSQATQILSEELSDDFEDADEDIDETETQTVPSNEPTVSARRYPDRERKPPDYYSYSTRVDEILSDDPKSYHEAINCDDRDKWITAMKEEYNALLQKHTWVLVDKPSHKTCIPCKWVYKLKRDADGNIIKYKARLVAKGYRQIEGVDYKETFAPVVRHSSFRTLLALAVQEGYKVRHMDVDTAFLNGELEEEVYMMQPQGFVQDKEEGKVCLLQKSLYGLKQASRAWNMKLKQILTGLGYTQTPSEACVYTKKISNENSLILGVYVDDIVILYRDDVTIDNFKKQFEKFFSCKDLGIIKYFTGINIDCSENNIKISQRSYIEELLKKYNMRDCKPVETPLAQKKLVPGTGESNYPYQALVGSLLWLAEVSRADLAYAVSYLSQFNKSNDATHWNAAKRCLRYLSGTKNAGITYKRNTELKEKDRKLRIYSDSDFANCQESRRSHTGFYVELAGGAVSWESRKQSTVALSSAEAEYMALSSATKEACFLKRFISEVTGKSPTVDIFTDSQSAQALALNPVHHNRTKHIDVKYHFIREKVGTKVIDLKYMPSQKLPADVLTKPLGRIKFNKCVQQIGIY